MTGNPSEAEDLVQETFLQVARRWHRVAAMDPPVAYARRILINLALDGARHRTRQQAELESPGNQPELPDEGAARALRQIDDLAEFRWALARLPPRERAVLVLRYWTDLPQPPSPPPPSPPRSPFPWQQAAGHNPPRRAP
jgi:RNA polymerase sigma factor (sigma-70 family)